MTTEKLGLNRATGDGGIYNAPTTEAPIIEEQESMQLGDNTPTTEVGAVVEQVGIQLGNDTPTVEVTTSIVDNSEKTEPIIESEEEQVGNPATSVAAADDQVTGEYEPTDSGQDIDKRLTIHRAYLRQRVGVVLKDLANAPDTPEEIIARAEGYLSNIRRDDPALNLASRLLSVPDQYREERDIFVFNLNGVRTAMEDKLGRVKAETQSYALRNEVFKLLVSKGILKVSSVLNYTHEGVIFELPMDVSKAVVGERLRSIMPEIRKLVADKLQDMLYAQRHYRDRSAEKRGLDIESDEYELYAVPSVSFGLSTIPAIEKGAHYTISEAYDLAQNVCEEAFAAAGIANIRFPNEARNIEVHNKFLRHLMDEMKSQQSKFESDAAIEAYRILYNELEFELNLSFPGEDLTDRVMNTRKKAEAIEAILDGNDIPKLEINGQEYDLYNLFKLLGTLSADSDTGMEFFRSRLSGAGREQRIPYQEYDDQYYEDLKESLIRELEDLDEYLVEERELPGLYANKFLLKAHDSGVPILSAEVIEMLAGLGKMSDSDVASLLLKYPGFLIMLPILSRILDLTNFRGLRIRDLGYQEVILGRYIFYRDELREATEAYEAYKREGHVDQSAQSILLGRITELLHKIKNLSFKGGNTSFFGRDMSYEGLLHAVARSTVGVDEDTAPIVVRGEFTDTGSFANATYIDWFDGVHTTAERSEEVEGMTQLLYEKIGNYFAYIHFPEDHQFYGIITPVKTEEGVFWSTKAYDNTPRGDELKVTYPEHAVIDGFIHLKRRDMFTELMTNSEQVNASVVFMSADEDILASLVVAGDIPRMEELVYRMEKYYDLREDVLNIQKKQGRVFVMSWSNLLADYDARMSLQQNPARGMQTVRMNPEDLQKAIQYVRNTLEVDALDDTTEGVDLSKLPPARIMAGISPVQITPGAEIIGGLDLSNVEYRPRFTELIEDEQPTIEYVAVAQTQQADFITAEAFVVSEGDIVSEEIVYVLDRPTPVRDASEEDEIDPDDDRTWETVKMQSPFYEEGRPAQDDEVTAPVDIAAILEEQRMKVLVPIDLDLDGIDLSKNTPKVDPATSKRPTMKIPKVISLEEYRKAKVAETTANEQGKARVGRRIQMADLTDEDLNLTVDNGNGEDKDDSKGKA